MENDKKKPFPQANDFNKIKQLILIPMETSLLSDNSISIYLGGLSERQARYYLAATKYLGAIDEDRRFTNLGNKLRKMDECNLNAELIRMIISVPVIGRVYFLQKMLNIQMNKSDIAELIEQENPGYTFPIYFRRAQTVIAWIEWINEQL